MRVSKEQGELRLTPFLIKAHISTKNKYFMAGEVTVARESGVNSLNAVSQSTRRQTNPFRSMAYKPLSNERREELAADGINIRIYEQVGREENNQRIDFEYRRQVQQLRDNLREKYPEAEWADRAFTTDRNLIAQAKEQRRQYNRELNQGVRRLKRLAAAAKKK